MKSPIETLAIVATGALRATSAFAQSAAPLVVPIENKPTAKLYVDSPRAGPRPIGAANSKGRALTAHTATSKIAAAMNLVHHT